VDVLRPPPVLWLFAMAAVSTFEMRSWTATPDPYTAGSA
jgi:hypothetical protein